MTFSDGCEILTSFFFLSLGIVDVWISEVFRRGRTLRVQLEKDKMLCMQSDDVVRDTTYPTLVQRRVGVNLVWS